MSKLKFGDLNFDNLVTYLFWINDNFRGVLPGRAKDESLDDQTIKSIRNKLWWRVDGNKNIFEKNSLKKVKKNLEKKSNKKNFLKKKSKKILKKKSKKNLEKKSQKNALKKSKNLLKKIKKIIAHPKKH